MTRFSSIGDDFEDVERLKQLIWDILSANILNNAAVDSGPGISAGAYQIAPSGVVMPWQGGSSLVGDAMQGVKNDADGAADAAQAAMNRANQAYDAQAVKPTTLYVDARDAANQTRAENAHSRANAAYSLAEGKPSQGYVIGRDLALQAQIDWILDNMVSKPDRWTDPPPKVSG